MKSRTPLWVVIAALLLLLGWSSWEVSQDRLELGRLRARLASQDQTLEKNRHETARYHDRIAALEKQLQQDKADGKAQALAKNASNPNGAFDLTPYMQKQPGYAEVHRLQLLRRVNQTYGDLKSLNLPPDQLAKVRDLLVERTAAPQDAREAALAAGIENGSRAMMEAVRNATEQIDSELGSLVGPDQLAALKDKPMESSFRSNLQYQIAPDMWAAGMTLTADQVDALAQAQQAAQKSLMQAARNGTQTGPSDFQKATNQALLDQAGKIMTPEQLAVFQQSVALNQKVQDLQTRAMQAAQQETGQQIHSWTMHGP